ncbi:hypothetical protein PEX1_040440 [Penicillium expansum]|uniref:NYN domain, limkain-b1-type n=1 Tax=Penicillium expansum TaxID=27334 RepID=A0A0A2IXA9_PENEN|nr:hypothetical protein PEX2_104540 [Penicillium expansum]KGO37828.1 hypothetical protein PEXP_078440 [Penicillium expansum]KGO47732.1 hypothetical protein PEX1_040440 [Penicillium expansum]KGO49821.1 hypothetical protein PEX2_104540 [Penicillium expansum]
MTLSDSPVPSNWDFTPVHDLLRSPIDGCTARPSRHNESTIPSLDEQQAKNDPHYTTNGSLVDLISQRSNPKLGDFGCLWELFNGTPAPASVTPSLGTTKTTKSEQNKAQPFLEELISTSVERPAKKVSFSGLFGIESSVPVSSNTSRIINEPNHRVLKDTGTGYTSHSSSSPKWQAIGIPTDFGGQPFTILKRTSVQGPSGTSANVKFGIPRTPPEMIASARVSDPSDTPTAKPKTRSRGKDFRKNTRNNPITSEESAGIDSDTSVVFDYPISEKHVAIKFVPSQVGTPDGKSRRYDTPPSSFEDNEWILNADTIRARSTLHQSAAERRVNLMSRLLGHFPDYAKVVSQVGLTLDHRPSEGIGSRPIHVFVDVSNIMVGFHDSVKTSRNIPLSARIRRVHMSFANLALIMERGRQTAKRVLVGSDRLPSVDEAERLGYEASILERVHKVKAITPRRNIKSRKNPGSSSQGGSSGPETVAASGERWVEQGVDEILHLKILESILDTEHPATIVLATGDAAVAEFSGGFMKMVERGLQRGWHVELVSFSQGTSYAYRKKEFRIRWGDQFKLVELDRYLEELFE